MADKNGDGSLDFDEVLKLLKTLNADVKKKYAREMFDVSTLYTLVLTSGAMHNEVVS